MKVKGNRIILLEEAPLTGEVQVWLEQAGSEVFAAQDVQQALSLAEQHRAQLVICSGDQLVALRLLLSGTKLDQLPLLTLCRSATTQRMIALRELCDDVLCWPEGQVQLKRRVEALARRWDDRLQVQLHQVHAQLLRELAQLLGNGVELEGRLFEALSRIVEVSGADHSLVMVWEGERDRLFIMGSTDDAHAVRLPVSWEEHPEARILQQAAECLEVVLTAEAAPQGELEASLRQRQLAQLVAFPLIWEGEAYGAFALCFGQARELSESLEMLWQASALIGLGLHSSDAYRRLKEQTHKSELERENKRQLEVLQKYEEFFQRAFDGILVLDRQQRVLYLNPAGEQITGYARRGLIGSSVLDIIEPSAQEGFAAALDQVGSNAGPQSFDLVLVTTSDDQITVSVSPSALLADDSLIVLSFRDVTEARALEHELRSTKEFLERLIDSTVYAIVASRVDGKLILFNKGAEGLFGFKEEEVIGQMTLADLFTEGAGDQLMEHLRGAEHGGPGRLEGIRREVLSASKELVPVALSANLLFEKGEEVGTVGIFRDLRERLRIEQSLSQAQEKLVETEKQAAVAELAGTTAHELNQPLTSIMGYAELLLRRIPADDSNHRAVETIRCEAERMAEIVRKIGKITRYETKAYVGETQIIDLEKSAD